jgi:hypothetical protein
VPAFAGTTAVLVGYNKKAGVAAGFLVVIQSAIA